MDKPLLLSAQTLPPQAQERLEKAFQVRCVPPGDPRFPELLAQAMGLIPGGLRVDDGLLQQAPELRIVSTVSVGYDRLDTDALRRRGILATHTPSVLDDSVADLILGLMLCTARRIAELDRRVKEGRWNGAEGSALFGVEVTGKTVGIIGMGRIGRAVADRCRLGFSMNVLYHNRHPVDFPARWTDLDTLLGESDFVVVMTPLTQETRGMIGLKEFQKMKRTAIFINASRGAVVREPDLVRALQEGLILGAGLDVYQQEPIDPADPLLQCAQVVTTPHIGSATQETRTAMALRAAENLLAFARGELPRDVVPELRPAAGIDAPPCAEP